MGKKDQTANTSVQKHFSPVVAVLGHVDHGKTSLLDAIRKTSIVKKEKGGITQAIGASSVEIIHDGQKRRITFIDTPGHAAFSQMRSRGAGVCDIGLLIVSLADGVKPQTQESIKALKNSKTPFIVVLTKSDLPDIIPEKVKKELSRQDVLLEGYGGDVPVIEVSSKTGSNIKELLDLIILMFDMQKSPESEKISSKSPLRAVVIEAHLDVRAGPNATVVIKDGSLNVRDELQNEGHFFKVRYIIDVAGKQVKSATVGEAVEIFGFEKVPVVGSIVVHKSEEAPVSVVIEPEQVLKRELVYKKTEEHKGLSIILIADTQGSLEAVVNSLSDEVKIVAKKTGEVNEADILLAKSTGSIVLSFNTKIKPEIAKLALIEKILLRNYEIIYELLDEVKDAQEGKLLSQMEQIYGQAEILAKFPFEKTFAYGLKVKEGRIARSDRVRILRGDEVIGECQIASLRVGKDTASKVEVGHEGGAVFNTPLDIRVGDMILSHS